jgi:hypothetical protein
MKLIKLTRGKFAKVDDADYEWLNQWKWCTKKSWNTFYARRQTIINGKKKTIIMHRLIMNTPSDLQVDHIDHDGLNNQRNNLRNCTNQQNSLNRNSYKSSPKYLGVRYCDKGKNKGLFTAHIRPYLHLGFFKTKEEAMTAYNNMAIKLFGQFANIRSIK